MCDAHLPYQVRFAPCAVTGTAKKLCRLQRIVRSMKHHLRSMLILLAAAAGPLFSPGVLAGPAVVELFTSQGCVSCPPADKLLAEIAGKPDVVALAWHVDYWDDGGWKDRFSMPEAAQRQRAYVRKLAKSGAFTPQVVVSGDSSFVGSNRVSMQRALAEDRDSLAIILSKTTTSLQIDLTERWRDPMDVYVIAYLNEATTRIGRGENANRSLREVNIVRSFKRLGKWNGTPQRMSLPLAALARDATNVAVLLQRPGQGAITGAATLTLR